MPQLSFRRAAIRCQKLNERIVSINSNRPLAHFILEREGTREARTGKGLYFEVWKNADVGIPK